MFDGFTKPPKGSVVIDPFARNGENAKWLGEGYITLNYDSNPTGPGIFQRDSLTSSLSFAGAYVIAKPPWRSRSEPGIDQTIFNRFGLDNLYKAFIRTLLRGPPIGGYIVVPLSFLNGTQENEINRRAEFFGLFQPNRINVFEESLFGAKYPCAAIQFMNIFYRPLADNYHQVWDLHFYPSGETRFFPINNREFKPISFSPQKFPPLSIEYPFYKRYLERSPKKIRMYKLIGDPELRKTESVLSLIRLQSSDTRERKAGFYTDSGRQIVIRGTMSKKTQERLARDFNELINEWRFRTNSFFMLQADETDFTLKRLPFRTTHEAVSRILWHYYQCSKGRTYAQNLCREQSSSQTEVPKSCQQH